MIFMSLLLKLVHLLYMLRNALFNFTYILKKPLYLTSAKYPARVQKDFENLKRVPVHLGIVLVEDDVSFKDIANMIIWCMLMGTTYISIYDRSGLLSYCGQVGSICHSKIYHTNTI